MRIVSLLPSATEIVCLLGLRDSLVGRSHACDFPADVAGVPVMTYSTLDDGLTSAEIDARVAQQTRDGLSIYGLHMDRLAEAKPDLILTQALVDTGRLGTGARVVLLEAATIEGVLQSILAVGELTGTQAVAQAQVQSLRERLDKVREAVREVAHRPTVAALEWLDPPFAPGHWVPEQIEIAGGMSVLGEAGKPSARIEWDDVIHTQAEMVVAMPCGHDIAGSVQEFLNQAGNEVWRDLPATYLWQLYAVDATAYFSRPGPRVVNGVEILAGMIHPNRWPAPGPEQALRVNDVVDAKLRVQERRWPY